MRRQPVRRAAPDPASAGSLLPGALRIRNDGFRPETFDGSAQLLIDTEAREYLPSSVLAGSYGPPGFPGALPIGSPLPELTLLTLNPGTIADGVLVFDLPLGVDAAEVELHGGLPFDLPGPGVRVRLP